MTIDVTADIKLRKDFLQLTGEDEVYLQAFAEGGIACIVGFIDDMYEFLVNDPSTGHHFQNTRHIDRVKALQVRYFQGLFSGEYGEDYYNERVRIGQAHERIGLEPQWYLGTYNYVLRRLLLAVQSSGHPTGPLSEALTKIIFYDMGLAIDTYIHAMQHRQGKMIDGFVQTLGEASEAVGSGTSSLKSSLLEQSSASQEQATAIAEISSTLSELRQTASQTMQQAEAVCETAQQSVRTVDEGRQTLSQSVEGMKTIRNRVEVIQDKILALSDHTQQIGDIITTVNEIAEQSKLLAFNASIEATRAGEFGKSFAVVANEMRDLAEQSKQATREVRKLLSDIREATNAAVLATEEGTKKAEEGQVYADKASQIIEDLGEVIQRSADAGQLISETTLQQETGVTQVAEAMVEIDKTVRVNAESMAQLQQVTDGLDTTAAGLSGMVDEFKDAKTRTHKAEYRHAGAKAA